MPKLRSLLAATGVAAGLYFLLRPEPYAFAGKLVVISGGSRGLGLVLARQLSDEGATLVLLARSRPELDQAREQLLRRSPDAQVLTIACDVRKRDELVAALRLISDENGPIDVLINNAGTMVLGPLEHMRVEDFEDSLAVHFWAPLHAMLTVLPGMRERGEGRIINIASIGGRVAVPHLLPYCAGKHALAGLSEGLGHSLRRYGVRVTTVYPGLMRTGSPPRVSVRGQRDKEYTWFALSDSLPFLTIDAERAARKILAAGRKGQARLTITPQARLLALADELAPATFARLSAMVSRLMPDPVGPEGDASEPGFEHETAVTRSFLTLLGRQAGARNNEAA
jgi:short-subunit dehydrogenase